MRDSKRSRKAQRAAHGIKMRTVSLCILGILTVGPRFTLIVEADEALGLLQAHRLPVKAGRPCNTRIRRLSPYQVERIDRQYHVLSFCETL